MDKHFYKCAFVSLAAVSLGAFRSLKKEEGWTFQHYKGFMSFINSSIVMLLFMYI